MSENSDLIDKLQLHLFADDDKLPVVFHKDEINMVKRYRYAFSRWLDNPTLSPAEIRNDLMSTFAISEATAYRDIPIVETLVGNLKQSTKEFMRLKANHMVHEGYKLAEFAETALEVKQAEAMIKAGMALVKINKLDKDDVFSFEWDEIKKIDYEVTGDVSVLGLEPLAESEEELEELKAKLRKKFGGDDKPIQEAEIVNE